MANSSKHLSSRIIRGNSNTSSTSHSISLNSVKAATNVVRGMKILAMASPVMEVKASRI